ncbi:MAG TPA: hypothetical protein VFI25_11270 [Planctomycetota bacterium]|nr:hypothetical protein [Planctomycetota bacterium]
MTETDRVLDDARSVVYRGTPPAYLKSDYEDAAEALCGGDAVAFAKGLCERGSDVETLIAASVAAEAADRAMRHEAYAKAVADLARGETSALSRAWEAIAGGAAGAFPGETQAGAVAKFLRTPAGAVAYAEYCKAHDSLA